MTHTCHAEGCNVVVSPKLLFCRQHWFLLSQSLQHQIWKHYVPGQEIRKDPTPEYLAAMRDAIEFVKQKEAGKCN